MKDNIALALSILAALVHIIAFCLYGRSMIKDKAHPNTAMLVIWAFGSFITLFNYDFVANDWLKESVALVDTVGCLAIFWIFVGRGKFDIKKLKNVDCMIVMADVVAIVIWQIYGSALIAYAVLQVSAALSIVPMCRQVWEGNEEEDTLVWFLWTSAYFISGVVVVLRWEGVQDIIYQANYTLMHLAVAIVCVKKAKKA
ncbi:MAG: hypothetical protein WC767_01810 [Candidatus Paceibacterota bacterium]